MTTIRRTIARAGLVLALGAAAAVAVPTAGSAADARPATVTKPLRGVLHNSFTATAPAPLLTLADGGAGRTTVLGRVTDAFTVQIDFGHPVADGFVLVTKTGSLLDRAGDRLDLAMVGTFELATFDVRYVFVVTGGTGRYAGATGTGTMHVPPPATFDPATGAGTGDEVLDGTITLLRRH